MTPNVFEYRFNADDENWECLFVDTVNNKYIGVAVPSKTENVEDVLKDFKKVYEA